MVDGNDPRWRRRAASAAAVLVALALSIGAMSAWTDYAFADSDEFARRAVAVLDSASVRDAIAEEVTDELVRAAPQLASFRFVLAGVIEDIVATDGFHRLFRAALREAHHAILTQGGQQLVVDLTEALAVISTTLQIANPDAAQRLPPDTANLIVDVSDRIQSWQLWQIGQAFNEVAVTSLVLTIGGLVALFAFEPRRQRALLKTGFAIVCAGVLVLGVTFLAPSIVAGRLSDPLLAQAVRGAVSRFVGDLRTISYWLLAYGVIFVSLGVAVAPQGEPLRIGTVFRWLRERSDAWRARSSRNQLVFGVFLVMAALVLVAIRETVVPVAVALVGAYLAYLGLFQILKVVAPAERPVRGHHARGVGRVTPRTPFGRGLAVAGLTAGFVLFVTVGFVFFTGSARDNAVSAAEIECNGSTDLCDRPLDKVVFAAAHNAMSASSQPGWLFAENQTGIPDQLAYGVRAFLVKSHYGRPTGVTIAGADIVVTDKQAEVAARPEAEQGEIGKEAADRAQQITASVTLPNVQREVYLCHVYCELGATKFSDVLTSVKQFLDRNPNEVLIFIIGDFVTTDDTDAVFQQAGLADRRWNYDPSQPLPTLRDLIDAQTNLVIMSENSTQPPAWNIGAYQELVQDTPFTFASPSDFNCDTNRGPADAPLFQINHWITTDRPPDPNEAAQVNSYDVLISRVRQCQAQRGKLPNIVGVNFYSLGDLLRVVNELNGVESDGS